MHVVELELEEFRSYRHLLLPFAATGLRLVGDNASGKSTLLEAISMLATTRSPRASTERELINWRSGEDLAVPPFARLRAVVERRDRRQEIEIGIQVDPARPNYVKKQLRLNGRVVRALDAVGALNAVLFSPEDIELISGSPSGRRRYLDQTISQFDHSYLRSLSRATRVLEQRNSLLKSLVGAGERPSSHHAAEQLGFWDAELIAHGSAVIAGRMLVVERMAELAKERFEQLAGRSDLALVYESTVPVPTGQRESSRDFDALQRVVARNFDMVLREGRGDEFRRGATLAGPHRDDLTFRLGNVDVSQYGSRGQQRLVVVALKLAITTLMTERAGEPPILMLDDVLSELDAKHRSWVLRVAAEHGAQILVTATDAELFRLNELNLVPAAQVEAGQISPIELISPNPES